MTIVLADLGGTNLRLARLDAPTLITKYKIGDYPSLNAVLRDFAPDISGLYFASAITPLDGIIEDMRFSHQSHWRIDLQDLKKSLNLKALIVLNDLEAAAYGLSALSVDQLTTLLPATTPQLHFVAPPKLLISIGTGVGHAFLFEKPDIKPFVQRTHGGHIPAFGVTEEHHGVITTLQSQNALGRDLIMENLIGGRAMPQLVDLVGRTDAIRLFWEFLGLYCNVIVSSVAAYGGIYLTGGGIDEMTENKTVDTASFQKYYLRPMVPVVVESLSSTPVYYCLERNLPILGLSRKAQS